MKKKTFLFSTILLFLTSGILGYFWYQKNTKGHQPPLNIYLDDYNEEKVPKWEKYSNDQIGVTFKYPKFNSSDRYTRRWLPRLTEDCVGFTSKDGNKVFIYDLLHLSEFYICRYDNISQCEKKISFLNEEKELEQSSFKGFETKEFNDLKNGEMKWCIFDSEDVYFLYYKWIPNEEEFEYKDQIISSIEFNAPKLKYEEIVENVTWEAYKNVDLGIEFEYPSSALAYDHYWDGNYDKCEGVEGEKQISVPYKVFTIDNYIFIKEEYYYEVDRSRNCKKIFNNAELLLEEHKKRGDYLPPWSIKFIKIDDEKELGDYIVNNFGWGGGCSLGSITETADKGVFDVVINQDGTDMGDTTCGVNYRHYLKYIPSKKMLFRLDNGHECIINGILGDCFDEQIVNSMNFF